MKKKKLFVKFRRLNIEIESEDGELTMGIPYCFNTKYGKSNLTHLLDHLGFDVEIKRSKGE